MCVRLKHARPASNPNKRDLVQYMHRPTHLLQLRSRLLL